LRRPAEEESRLLTVLRPREREVVERCFGLRGGVGGLGGRDAGEKEKDQRDCAHDLHVLPSRIG